MIKNFILFQLGKFLTAIVLILFNTPTWAASVDSTIRDRIIEFNETLPVDLGEGVRMLSVVVLDDKVLYGGQEKKVIHWGFEYSFYDKYAEKIKILKLERISKIVSLCDFSLAKSAIKINSPKVDIVTNISAHKIQGEPDEIRRSLVLQVTSMVRWQESIKWMVNNGIKSMVEIGAGQVLSGLNKRIDKDLKSTSIEDPDTIDEFLKNLR